MILRKLKNMFDRFFYSILGFYCLSQGVFAIITKKLLLKGLKPIWLLFILFFINLYLFRKNF